MSKFRSNAQSGFTLVELAIVLVIIGLIIGGVLVGQDMIKGAEVRATAGQFEKYSSAVSTFRDKFGAVPGDMTSAKATQFGAPSPLITDRTGAAGQSDGNGLLEACNTNGRAIGCETGLFWVDLNFASLIDNGFSTAVGGTAPPAIVAGDIPKYIPPARIGRGNYITVYATSGYNYFQLGGWGAQTATNWTLNPTITPQEAFNMDTKLDDGRPNTGATQARLAAGTSGTFATVVDIAAASPCVTGTAATDNYLTTSVAAAGTPACSVRVRFN